MPPPSTLVNTCRLKIDGSRCGTPFERERDVHLLEVARLDPHAAAKRRARHGRSGDGPQSGAKRRSTSATTIA